MDLITGSRVVLLESVRFSNIHFIIFLVALFVLLFVGLTISAGLASNKGFSDSLLVSYSKFFYASFLKPHHSSSDGGQQSALESFYETQVCV
jgi:betaine lipid synthase